MNSGPGNQRSSFSLETPSQQHLPSKVILRVCRSVLDFYCLCHSGTFFCRFQKLACTVFQIIFIHQEVNFWMGAWQAELTSPTFGLCNRHQQQQQSISPGRKSTWFLPEMESYLLLSFGSANALFLSPGTAINSSLEHGAFGLWLGCDLREDPLEYDESNKVVFGNVRVSGLNSDLLAYCDNFGIRPQCHCKQVASYCFTVARNDLLWGGQFGTSKKCHCSYAVSM